MYGACWRQQTGNEEVLLIVEYYNKVSAQQAYRYQFEIALQETTSALRDTNKVCMIPGSKFSCINNHYYNLQHTCLYCFVFSLF